MGLDESFYQEEIRSDFLVTERRKRIWARELQMLEVFDEVCQKHHITYYAYYGTLLGAVRHQGFIPWDDDIDVIMFRDEYERFQSLAPSEFKEPYFYQNAYTDSVIFPSSKIRDDRTTAISPLFRHLRGCYHQGMFLDIFPFDSVFDGTDPQMENITRIREELWYGISNPEDMLEILEKGGKMYLGHDYLMDYMRKDTREKFQIYEAFNLSSFGKSENVNYIPYETRMEYGYKSVKKEWFRDIVYLPFEHMFLPVPAEYDKILTQCYGNYHEPVQGTSVHKDVIIDPDIPYEEYLENYL